MKQEYLNFSFQQLMSLADKKKNDYINTSPFPHIELDNIFADEILNSILLEFPENIEKIGTKFNNKAEKKLTLNNSALFSKKTNDFINFLNSQLFLTFIQSITSIEEKLIPDPYLIGGGLHELKNGGHLNIHTDFNFHPSMKLDRRLNILIYFNRDWKEHYGGNLELWDTKMTKCIKKIIPTFNKTVIFSTTDFSYHGNPQVINCPINQSRKSLALYYYSNGRPHEENKLGSHSTIFKKRPRSNDVEDSIEYKKIFGKFYYRKKNKF